jgi:integrase
LEDRSLRPTSRAIPTGGRLTGRCRPEAASRPSGPARAALAWCLGHLSLGAIKPQTIRSWRGSLLAGGTTEPQAVKSYSLLRAILNTAVREDEILKQNPCRIPGYDRYHTPERPVATVAQVLALAVQMPPRYVALITVAAFSGLRWGELAALRRCDVDLAAGTVRVPRKLAAL